jgi:N-acetylglutamate synthase-like GNAT family acetyltransferase
VAQLEDHVAGLVVAHLREAPDMPILFPRRHIVVDTLVDRERFRRSGIGRALMQRIHDWAEAHGVAEIELTVWEFNGPARAFYECLGYGTVGRRMCKASVWGTPLQKVNEFTIERYCREKAVASLACTSQCWRVVL